VGYIRKYENLLSKHLKSNKLHNLKNNNAFSMPLPLTPTMSIANYQTGDKQDFDPVFY
jgi:hypothetical protein